MVAKKQWQEVEMTAGAQFPEKKTSWAAYVIPLCQSVALWSK